MNCSEWIEKHADFQPDRIALRFVRDSVSEDAWNYAFLENRISSWARGLKHQLGVRRGDRVAFLGTNHPEMLALMFACARLGAILVPLNWRLAPPELAYIARNAGLHVLVAETDFIRNAGAIRNAMPNCHMVALEFLEEEWIPHE